MDYVKLGIGSTLLFLGQVLVWFQAYAPIKFEWLKNKGWWFPYLLSIPVAFFFIKGISYIVSGTGGEMWPSRIIGFSVGVISFSFLTSYFNNEPITLKTGVCLFLCLCILGVQMLWKTN
jgi:hypothetical protein